MFFYSRDRTAEHPERHLAGFAGILQADAYAGFDGLYAPDRSAGPITEAACWAHARRKFFVLADVTAKARGALAVIAPLAFEAVSRIDLIFDVEREINGLAASERLAVRSARVAPLVTDLETWMRRERGKRSPTCSPVSTITTSKSSISSYLGTGGPRRPGSPPEH